MTIPNGSRKNARREEAAEEKEEENSEEGEINNCQNKCYKTNQRHQLIGFKVCVDERNIQKIQKSVK